MIEYGKCYHIYNRGINSQKIFFNDGDYTQFINLISVFLSPVADVYAYALMGNHFHFALRIRELDEIGFLKPSNSNTNILMVKWKTYFPNNQEEMQQGDFRKKPTPDKMIQHLFSTYVKWFNKKHERTGALLEHSYERKLVFSEAYLKRLIIYIHNNPVKHGFCEHPIEYAWTSYLSIVSLKPSGLARETVLGWFDNQANFKLAHQNIDGDFNDIQHLLIE